MALGNKLALVVCVVALAVRTSEALKVAACLNINFPLCFGLQFNCPSRCSDSCSIDCQLCRPVCDCDKPGSVCQDPKFVGADGITFYFHGKKDRDFCLVTDSSLHINAHFIGKRGPNMKRDFTWVQALGILFRHHRLHVGAMRTATWSDSVDRLDLALDGQPISIPQREGAVWNSSAAGLTITRLRGTNAVELAAEGNFRIKAAVVPITRKDSLVHNYGVTREDCFAHLDLSFKFHSLTPDVSGVLGQTYAPNYVSKAKVGVPMPVLGGDRQFASSGLFSTDCAVARFAGNDAPGSTLEFGDLSCTTGIAGSGVVCKR